MATPPVRQSPATGTENSVTSPSPRPAATAVSPSDRPSDRTCHPASAAPSSSGHAAASRPAHSRRAGHRHPRWWHQANTVQNGAASTAKKNTCVSLHSANASTAPAHAAPAAEPSAAHRSSPYSSTGTHISASPVGLPLSRLTHVYGNASGTSASTAAESSPGAYRRASAHANTPVSHSDIHPAKFHPNALPPTADPSAKNAENGK